MPFLKTEIPDVLIFEPKIFSDNRGFFFESFNSRDFATATGADYQFVQDNQSHSTRGVLRGLHYQVPPYVQGKLVRVVSGSVYDVAVDIRRGSPTFGKWVGETLSEHNKRQLWIPPGFAHGFLTLSDHADFLYKTTSYYSAGSERSILWSDAELSIGWPIADTLVVSAKDRSGCLFRDADYL